MVPTDAGTPSVAEQMAAHEGLVHWVVRQQWRGELAFADALHEGRLGLWRALVGYDPARGTRFSSYAVPAIQRAVWAAVAEAMGGAAMAADRTVGSSAPPTVSEDDGPAEAVERRTVQAAVGALVAQLPPPMRRVIVAHYGLDGRPPASLAAIGRQRGVSRQRVHQVHTAALVWLAQPDRARALRRLVGRQARADYQQTLARQRHRARVRRGRARRR
jgi:RNA polymerase sigma factor (sigma-70 family)